jgi:saccharopine dehydrogenase-like NADP-dependent oxidoreductase
MDIHCLHDDATGFSAMEQMTGYSTAIYAAAVARGEVPAGVVRYETAIKGHDFVDALRKRGIDIKIQEGPIS